MPNEDEVVIIATVKCVAHADAVEGSQQVAPASTSSSAKVPPKVAKPSSAKGTLANATPTPMSSIVPLPLATGSTLRKLSVSQSSDSSPSKAVSERKRKKTNANEVTDAEWIEVKGRVANKRERLTHEKEQGQTNEIEEMMESSIVQCEKAMQTGK